MAEPKDFNVSCPLPLGNHDRVQLAHGGGGRLMHDLLERLILPAFGSAQLLARHDGAVLEIAGGRLAFTTDSYVVSPLFFPGGDIGSLAVNGTVNDLAMCGARPLGLSAGFILEEGFPMEALARVVDSMRASAQAAGVPIVTGDTKVVDKGKADGIFINTAGVGLVEHGLVIAPASIRPGDAVLLSGDIGRHGIAVMAAREGLAFETPIQSDCAPLAAPVLAMIQAGVELHCLRDLTRGGLATSVIEIGEAAPRRIELLEAKIPVEDNVRGACEILGFDPLYLANEGRFVAFLPADQTPLALAVLRGFAVSENPVVIGTVAEGSGTVLRSPLGTSRYLDMITGEQLPRIC